MGLKSVFNEKEFNWKVIRLHSVMDEVQQGSRLDMQHFEMQYDLALHTYKLIESSS